MRRAIHYALGIATAVLVTVPLRTAAGQDARPNSCALIDTAEVTRLTGKKELFGGGPGSADEDLGYPKHRSVCMFAGFIFELTTNVTPESFARGRRNSAPDRWKVQSISGLGDEAYYLWDTRPGDGVRNVLLEVRSGSKGVGIEKLTSSDSVEVVKKMLFSIATPMVSRVK